MPSEQTRSGARRWALLATSLALLGVALAARAGSSPPPLARSARHGGPATGTATTSRAALGPVSPSTSVPPAQSSAAGDSSLRATGATSSTAMVEAAPPSGGTGAGAGTASLGPVASSEQIVQGWLLGPTAISASYSRSSSTTGRVAATWTSSAVLTLSADCPPGRSSVTGPSPLTLTASGPACTVTLAGPPDVVETSFSLDLGPV
jgi:hypothetical protein